MKSIAAWSVDNKVAVNLIMVFLFVAGLLTVLKMRREMFPQFALDMVTVSVDYPGASPEEVEEGICIKIEEKIKGIEGVSKTYSWAREGNGSVTVELNGDVEIQKVLDDVRTEVDLIDNFPEEAKDPVVTEIVNRNPAISVAVYGPVGELLLRQIAEEIRDNLVMSPAISMATLVGVRNYEIAVEVTEENLRKFNLTFDHVVQAIRTGSLDLPGGRIKTVHGEILIRAEGRRYTGPEFEALPLITTEDGTVIRLGQVARVIDGFEDSDIITKFNGQPAALVQVNRTRTEDVVAISDAVKTYVAEHAGRMPPGVQLTTWFDLSDMVRDRINLLLRNGAQGIVLVFLGLALFLNIRLAFWVAAGIPIAFMGAFMVLDTGGETINMISLFAFIMTLGILVDDAIILGENVYTHFNRGKSARAAVVDGIGEVGGPVIMAVLTTVVAFLPLLFIAGIMGKFIAVMPTAVIAILIVSLLEALVILPAHLYRALRSAERSRAMKAPWHERLRVRVEASLQRFIDRIYVPALGYVVENRYFAFAIGAGVLIISIGTIIGGYVPFVFMAKGESDYIIAEVNYPLGTPSAITGETVDRMERIARELNRRYRDRIEGNTPLITNTFSLVGAIPRRDWKPPEFGGQCGEVWIELLPSARRPRVSVNEVINAWRRAVGEIPGIDQLSFFTMEGGPAGSPIEIRLVGQRFDMLQQAAEELKTELRRYPGTFDVSDTFRPGKEEKQIHIRPGARSLGVTMGSLGRQVRQAFYGEEAVRIQRGKDDIKVQVRYAEEDRNSLSGLDRMWIHTPDGRAIPLGEVADVTQGRAYAMIRRVDRQRQITVTSDLDENTANASQIVAELDKGFLQDLKRRYPGLTYDLEGQEKRTRESLDSLKKGFTLALMGIFLLLASQFRSYAQPVIIMISIPFGLIGAIFGHLVMGLSFTIVSIFGIVALSGIVVNDALILIDFINRSVRDGAPVREAVIESGRARFRPVLLTSLTTVAGLFPLLLERSFQAQFLIPMAVSISFGLIAATLLTLLFVPALYMIVGDVAGHVRHQGNG